jgi:hypothetical protein
LSLSLDVFHVVRVANNRANYRTYHKRYKGTEIHIRARRRCVMHIFIQISARTPHMNNTSSAYIQTKREPATERVVDASDFLKCSYETETSEFEV